MSATPLRFYFDYISPNAYLAWTQLPALADKYALEIEPVPVLFAGLLGAHGRVGPAEVPVLMRWMWKNILRKTAVLHVPFNPPAFHPFNPLLALRVSSLPMSAGERRRLIDALFHAVWVEAKHVSEPEVVREIADADLVAAARSPEAKDRLRAQTDDALARGVFGVPSMEVKGEIFWGYDDWPQLMRFLEGRDTLDPEAWNKWSTPLKASATRPR